MVLYDVVKTSLMLFSEMSLILFFETSLVLFFEKSLMLQGNSRQNAVRRAVTI